MKSIITGGAGFIGSHLASGLLALGHEVVIVDNFSGGSEANLPKSEKLSIVNASISKFRKIAPHFKSVDYVFHHAALVSVPESAKKPLKAVKVNGMGTINVLEAARLAEVKKVVFASSAAVYGQLPGLPKKESDLLDPRSPYAVTKINGERFCEFYWRQHGLPTTSLRYFNVYGPRQNPESQYAAAIPCFISRALESKPITIYGDGEQTRDFVFVGDIVRANIAAAERQESNGAVINVCSNTEISVNQLAEKIIALTNSKSTITHAKDRPGDIKHSRGENALMAKLLGIAPKTSLDDGLSETIRYLRPTAP